MSATSLYASQPWSVFRQEDRRFRRILLQALAVGLVIGVITPSIQIPQPDIEAASELPPRRVKLLAEQSRLATTPEPIPAPPVVTGAPRPQTAPEQKPVAPVESPRQKAARSGVLAMQDALSALQSSTPQTVTSRARTNPDAEVYEAPTQPSVLGASVTRGSGGVEGGVDHQSVLGEVGLPGRDNTGVASSGFGVGATARGQLSSGPPGVVRSQDVIQELLDRNKGAMYTLYNRELRENSGLQGKLVMSITIAPTGEVTRCVILSSELGSAALERQLVALVSGIHFGNLPGATVVTTRIPVEFFPR